MSRLRVGTSPDLCAFSTMPIRQCTRALQLVADAMRLDVDPSTWVALEARVPPGPIAQEMQQQGQAIAIALLGATQDRDTLLRTLRAGDAPILCVSGPEATDVPVAVVAEDAPGRLALWVVHPDGSVVKQDARTPEEIAAAVVRLCGGQWYALAPYGLQPSATGDGPRRATPDEKDDAQAELEAVLKSTKVLSRLWQLMLRDRREITVVFFYAGLAGLFSLTLPLSVGAIVQLIQGGLILQSAALLIAYVIVGTVVAGVLQVLQLGVVERIQQRVFARLALEYAFHLPRVRYDVSLRVDLPESMNRLFEAVLIQKSLAKFLLDTSQALLTIAFGLILLTFYHPYFTLVGILLVLTLGLMFWLTGPKGLATSLMESKYKYRAVHWLEEVARAFHAFKFAGRSNLALSRMDAILTKYLKYRRKHFKVLVQQAVSIVVFKTAITAALLIVGTLLVVNRQITLGQFVASEIVVVTVLAGVEKLVLSLSVVYDMLTSVEKAGYVTDLPVDEVGRTVLPVAERGMSVEARGLSYDFADGGARVLRDVSLMITPGQRVAITGFRGAGRSTLLRLLGGLFDDYRGVLLVDGVSMHDLNRDAFRERVGQILSLTDLFDGTIADNITVGRDHIDEAAIWDALRAVGMDTDVQAMREGLQTHITNSGRSLPAHMAAKLLFAQGIAGHPRLILLDDMFLNLLADDRRRLLNVLIDPARAWTVIAVSHDPALLESFDRVLVIRDGEVAADGSFSTVQRDPYCSQLLDVHARSGELARRVRAEGSGDDDAGGAR